MKKSDLCRLVVAVALPVLVHALGSEPVFGAALTLSFQQTWGGPTTDRGEGVAVASDGSIYLTGHTLSFGAGDSDAILLKFASDGTLIWQRTYGTPGGEFATDVAVGPDDSVYIAGSFSNADAFLAKFTPDGSLVWQRTWGGSGSEFAEGVAVAGDGSIYITGSTRSFGAGQDDAFPVKFTPDGAVIWERTWGGTLFELADDVAVAADGNIYVAGDTNSFFGNDAFLLKYAPDGTLMWERDWRVGEIGGSTAAVASAPPYEFDRAPQRTRTPDAFLETLVGTVTMPQGNVGVPNGIVLMPDGSLTFGGGLFDAALLKVLP